jgi:hypothetical protein
VLVLVLVIETVGDEGFFEHGYEYEHEHEYEHEREEEELKSQVLDRGASRSREMLTWLMALSP